MPALLRYFSELIHFKTSNPNPIPLHGNPVLDNFVFKHAAVADWKDLCHSAFVRVATLTQNTFWRISIFATAHSRGLRLDSYGIPVASLFFATAHSRGLRRRTCRSAVRVEPFATAHSCGLRPSFSSFAPSSASFATAHSRGLRLHPSATDTATCFFATAHSRGLRLFAPAAAHFPATLPQRIRAGCDHGFSQHTASIVTLPQRIRAGCDRAKAAAALADRIFATAHSRGLRRFGFCPCRRAERFASAHSRGLRRSRSALSAVTVSLCLSAFARVATST